MSVGTGALRKTENPQDEKSFISQASHLQRCYGSHSVTTSVGINILIRWRFHYFCVQTDLKREWTNRRHLPHAPFTHSCPFQNSYPLLHCGTNLLLPCDKTDSYPCLECGLLISLRSTPLVIPISPWYLLYFITDAIRFQDLEHRSPKGALLRFGHRR